MSRRRLVFVPGFLASMIFRPHPWDPNRGELVWMSNEGVVLGDYKYLDPTLPGSELAGGKLYAGPPLESYHRGWYQFACLPDVESSAWGYDFRQSTSESGTKLAAHLIRLAEEYDEVDVVAHSMGGLVACRAFDSIPVRLRNKFKRFVSIGTPWLGAFGSVGYLCGHGPTLEDIAKYNSYLDPVKYVLNKEYLKRLLARWPGVYDLLPAPALIRKAHVGRDLEPWTAETWAVSNNTVSGDLLAQSLARREFPFKLLPSMRHLNIVGTKLLTPGPLPDLGSRGYFAFHNLDIGDGVVPLASAQSPFTQFSETVETNAEHVAMPNQEIVHYHTREFLFRF